MIVSSFEIYYKTGFSEDLNRFFSTIPDESRFHHGYKPATLTIQFNRLTRDCDHLDFLSPENKVNFGIALFFTVLADMVCYSQFREYYEKFRGLTLYPKFIGNCMHACSYHFNPREILEAMNCSANRPISPRSSKWLDFREKFKEAIPTMEEEAVEFFEKYLIEIDGNEFWKRCKSEFPTFALQKGFINY